MIEVFELKKNFEELKNLDFHRLLFVGRITELLDLFFWLIWIFCLLYGIGVITLEIISTKFLL